MYLIISLIAFMAITLLIVNEKKLRSKYFWVRRHKRGFYLFIRFFFLIFLFSSIQQSSYLFGIDKKILYKIDTIIFILILSSSYVLKKFFLHHLQNVSNNQSTIKHIQLLLRVSLSLIIIYAVLGLFQMSEILNTFLILLFIFCTTMAFFLYFQERLILHLDRKKIDKTICVFLSRVFLVILFVLFITFLMQVFKIPTAPLLTILGAFSIAVGLSLQSSLSNLAAGILIIIFKPYRLNDIITYDVHMGTIIDINFLFTKVLLFSGEYLYIPNSQVLSTKDVINCTECKYRRLEVVVRIDYACDYKAVMKVGLDTFNADKKILKNPSVKVFIDDFTDSGLKLRYWIYMTPDDYEYWYLNDKNILYAGFKKHEIDIPFNKIIVEMDQTNLLK